MEMGQYNTVQSVVKVKPPEVAVPRRSRAPHKLIPAQCLARYMSLLALIGGVAGLSLPQLLIALVGMLVVIIVGRIVLKIAWRLVTIGVVVVGGLLILIQFGLL